MPNLAAGGQNQEGFLENLGILIGLLVTDGYINPKNYSITFTGNSEELQNKFKELLEFFGVEKFYERIDDKNVKVTQVKNKNLVNLVLSYIPTVKTKDNTKITLPNFFWKLEKKKLANILKYMFSADGAVILGIRWHKFKKKWCFVRRVEFSSKNEYLKREIKHLLEKKFNIKANCWKRGVVIEKKDEILKFQKEIRFVPGVKISKKSKRWEGFTKNQILDLVCKILKNKKSYFSTRIEIENYLKSLLVVDRVQGSTG